MARVQQRGGGRLGRTVESGDLNGDSIDDVIAFAWEEGPDFQGKGYIFYGKSTWPNEIDLAVESADVTIQNAPANGFLGHSLALGDVNADGCKDLLFSSFEGSTKDRDENGIGYILFGGDALPTTIDVDTYSGMTTIHGRSDLHLLGYQAKAGDFNGDGRDDCLFTGLDLGDAIDGDQGHGVIILNHSMWPREIDLEYGGYEWLFLGGSNNRWFGTGAYLMDVNDDDFDDLIIGDPGYNYVGRSMSGCVYVFYGSPIMECNPSIWEHYE